MIGATALVAACLLCREDPVAGLCLAGAGAAAIRRGAAPAAGAVLGWSLALLGDFPGAAGAALGGLAGWAGAPSFRGPVSPSLAGLSLAFGALLGLFFVGPFLPLPLVLGAAAAGALAHGARDRRLSPAFAIVAIFLAGSASLRFHRPGDLFLAYTQIQPEILDLYYRPLEPRDDELWAGFELLKTPTGRFFVGTDKVFYSDGGRAVENPLTAPIRFAAELVGTHYPGAEIAVSGLVTEELCRLSPPGVRLWQPERWLGTPHCGSVAGGRWPETPHRMGFPPFTESLGRWLASAPGPDESRWICGFQRASRPKRQVATEGGLEYAEFRVGSCEIRLGTAFRERSRALGNNPVLRRYVGWEAGA